MKEKYIWKIFIGIVFTVYSGCAVKWTQAVQYGDVVQTNFNERVDIQIDNRLIFVPVTIGRKDYLFLFDSGAPFSISQELQNYYAFKAVSKGHIVDSDHNRKKVKWVQVDSVRIGDVAFVNQSAFVGDFNANPILNCLNIDGIIGSNLMRHCNWTIDQDNKQLTMSSTIDQSMLNNSTTIPFQSDDQYNMFVNINFGEALVKHILIDYGSNGSIALNRQIFANLKEKGILGEVFLEKGVKQSGIIGEPVELIREISRSDSVRILDQPLSAVELRTGKSDLIGNKVLSRFIITIDWENQNLHFAPSKTNVDVLGSFGFRIGFTMEKGVYIQSVVQNSVAHEKGIYPDMQVAQVDSLDFEHDADFCDYIQLKAGDTIYLELIDSKGQRQEYFIDRTLFKKG